MTETNEGGRSWLAAILERHPLLKVVLYYLALWVAIGAFQRWFPEYAQAFSQGELPADSFSDAVKGIGQPPAAGRPAGADMGMVTVFGMAMAFLLMLPVVWIYAMTRQKRGFQQSLVQTLVLLPIVVAGVVMMVKNSTALAFSLGGIVGAVAFRNRLEDTKDAIYVFLAIAIGLASGVQALPIGLAMSLFFNGVILLLWYADFGRMPAQMGAGQAQKRAQMAKDMVGAEKKKTGEFVAALDQQILQSMTPDQLESLAEKAMDRKKKMSDDLFGTDDTGPKFDGLLKLKTVAGASADELRALVERHLAQDTKEWRFEQAGMGDGGSVTLEYSVRFKKSAPRPIVIETLRRAILNKAEVTFE
jgi:hypothetical protein